MILSISNTATKELMQSNDLEKFTYQCAQQFESSEQLIFDKMADKELKEFRDISVQAITVSFTFGTSFPIDLSKNSLQDLYMISLNAHKNSSSFHQNMGLSGVKMSIEQVPHPGDIEVFTKQCETRFHASDDTDNQKFKNIALGVVTVRNLVLMLFPI
jgi:hypothetical protein